MIQRFRTQITAVAAAAALAALGVAYAQSTLVEPPVAAEAQTAAPAEMAPAPMTEAPVTEAAPAQAMPAPVEPAPAQRIEIIAEPAYVPPPPGMTAPLDRGEVIAEFEAMRAAGVLVPAGEAGDTLETAERRNAYHQAQADEWIGYQVRLAEVRLANQQALDAQARALEAQMQADMQAAQLPGQAPATTQGSTGNTGN